MKSGTQVAVAIGTGYVLGRRRKMKLATMIAGAAMVGGIGGIGGQLARRGAKLVGSADLLGKVSPELGEISDIIRNDLLDAGRSAARTAVNSRIDSLSDRLRDQADAWRNPAEAARGTAETARGTARTARGAVGLGRGDDEEDEEFPEDEETGEARANGRARRGSRPAPDEPADEYEDEGEEDEGEEEEVTVPARRPRRARSEGTASPIRRTRR